MFVFLFEKTSCIAVFLSFLLLTRYVSASGLIELLPISIDSGTQPEILNRKLLLKDNQPVSYNSFDKIIENEFNVDIQQRGIFGIQSELTIRATNFEQNLVAIDGISFSDPQTSHHSMNLPLTGHSWESIEVIKGLNSSLYGSHAIGGVVDFRTVNPEADSIKLSSCIGEKQLRIFGVGLDRANDLLSCHISFERSTAASYRPETEFESYVLFSKFIFHDITAGPKIIVAQSAKGFGASSFYSSNYPRQEESIKTGLYMLSFDVFHKNLCLSPVFYFRRHWDKFILDRSSPDWFRNIHTTHIKGVKIPVNFKSFDCNFNIFTEMRQETIDSTNLSSRGRNVFSIGAAVSNELFRNFNFFLSLRVDDYSSFNAEVSPGAVLTYRLSEDKTVFSSFQRAYRVPSFTELYYDSPANAGNSGLSAEESLSWELGYVKKGEHSYGASVFRRLDYNRIDWVKNSMPESWSAKNMPRSETDGFECWAYRNGFKLSYSFLDSCYNSDFLYSKYSANYLRHSLSCVKSFEFRLLNIVLNLSYKNRSGGDEFINLDLELNRSMKLKNHAANLYLKVFNATNVKQCDVEGVVLPGRWITSGLSLEF